MLEAIVILILFLGASTAAFVAYVNKKRRRSLLMLRDAVRTRGALSHEVEISIFDVFWDLGASDFALEVMASQGLLPRDLQEMPMAHDALGDRIAEQGGYDAFIRENLETIQEFFEEHRRVGARRALPMLTTRNRKTLALPAVGSSPQPSTDLTKVPRPVQLRGMGRATELLDMDTRPVEVDLDEIARVDPVAILKGVLFGESAELDRWWKMRSLRSLRDELNGRLRRLYEAYAFEANSDPDYYRHLYDLAERWQTEARRLDQLKERRPWQGQPWAIAGEALVVEATATARQLAFRARANVDQTLELIHSHARRGDYAMAGYLVYLNHHALFVGRISSYVDVIKAIETLTYKLQDEVRSLARKNVI
ncbi:MAG: hypothetical protein R3E66_08465 [bacterium]